MGMNNNPMIRKTGSAVFAVMIGCQAGRRCCLKAVSSPGKRRRANREAREGREEELTSGFATLLLFAIFFRIGLGRRGRGHPTGRCRFHLEITRRKSICEQKDEEREERMKCFPIDDTLLNKTKKSEREFPSFNSTKEKTTLLDFLLLLSSSSSSLPLVSSHS